MSAFGSKKDIRRFVQAKSVAEKKPFKITKTEPMRYVVKCTKDCCRFKLLFRGNDLGVFELVEERAHTCISHVGTVKREWVRERVNDILNSKPKVTPEELSQAIRDEFHVTVKRKMISNALADVKRTRSDVGDSFGLTASFLEALKGKNEGTTTSLVSVDGVFVRAFLCPGVCSRAFKHTTKIIGLDACHVKTKHGGTLLVLTVLDGNGSVFPAALGIAESENASTWCWFLNLVKIAFAIDDGGEGLVFISDREKGIDISTNEVFPRAAHSNCVFHIAKNVKVRYKTSLNGLLFKAANALDKKTFNDTIEEMKNVHMAAGLYVAEIEPKTTARAYFPARRLGPVTSNIAESMNWWLNHARFQNPVGLFSTFIEQLNQLFERRRDKYAAMNGNELPAKVSKMLDKSVQQAETLGVHQHTRTSFQVQSRHDQATLRVVDMDAVSCSCGFRDEFGVPCRHICAVALVLGQEPSQYVVEERRRAALVATYVGDIKPVDTFLLEDDGLKPPVGTKKRGRRKHKRIPSAAEKAPIRTVKCSQCGKRGHNARTCKSTPQLIV